MSRKLATIGWKRVEGNKTANISRNCEMVVLYEKAKEDIKKAVLPPCDFSLYALV